MATIINNPGGERTTSDGGMGVIVGAVVIIILIALFFIYGLPAIRKGGAPNSANINVQLPSTNEGGGTSAQ